MYIPFCLVRVNSTVSNSLYFLIAIFLLVQKKSETQNKYYRSTVTLEVFAGSCGYIPLVFELAF